MCRKTFRSGPLAVTEVIVYVALGKNPQTLTISPNLIFQLYCKVCLEIILCVSDILDIKKKLQARVSC